MIFKKGQIKKGQKLQRNCPSVNDQMQTLPTDRVLFSHSVDSVNSQVQQSQEHLEQLPVSYRIDYKIYQAGTIF